MKQILYLYRTHRAYYILKERRKKYANKQMYVITPRLGSRLPFSIWWSAKASKVIIWAEA